MAGRVGVHQRPKARSNAVLLSNLLVASIYRRAPWATKSNCMRDVKILSFEHRV